MGSRIGKLIAIAHHKIIKGKRFPEQSTSAWMVSQTREFQLRIRFYGLLFSLLPPAAFGDLEQKPAGLSEHPVNLLFDNGAELICHPPLKKKIGTGEGNMVFFPCIQFNRLNPYFKTAFRYSFLDFIFRTFPHSCHSARPFCQTNRF